MTLATGGEATRALHRVTGQRRTRGAEALLRRAGARSGFSLIEVLVVAAVIALLISVLLPSLSRARAQSRSVLCDAQLRQLMGAALFYTSDHGGRLPGTATNDMAFMNQYAAGTRTDWLSWFGTWKALIGRRLQNPMDVKAWSNAPRGGRLWRYYREPNILRCPSAVDFNGKLSYSMPEAVALAFSARDGRAGLPARVAQVRFPALTIQFADEDEEHGISNHSMDDGLGLPERFAERHLGKAGMAFFDGHAESHHVPPFAGGSGIEVFEGWMISIAPFNSDQTFRPWKFRGAASLPKFKPSGNTPKRPGLNPCTYNGGVPGC